jgi:uncharacterized membrane protein
LILAVKEILFRYFGKRRNILLLEIAIYALLFSIFTTVRYYSFNTYAYDLGTYNQVLHTTLFNGKLLYSPTDLIANPTGSLFGIHFSPIFFVMLPFYAIYPNPPTLLVIQSVVLALGALPLYLFASRRLLNEKLALVIATLYLLSPLVQGINWYDFHPEAFLPLFFLSALYFFDVKNKFGYFASVLLALMCLEFSSVIFIFVSVYLFVKLEPWKKASIDKSKLWWLLATITISVVWLIISLQIIRFFNPIVQPLTGDVYWREIGANSLLDVPSQALLHPGRIVSALQFDGWQKLSFVLVILGSVAFLPLLEPLIAICLIPWFVPAFLSNYTPFYQFNIQYTAFIIPFVAYGAVLGLQRIKAPPENVFSKKPVKAAIAILICFALVLCYFTTPLNTKPFNSIGFFTYGIPQFTQHDQKVLNLLALLPENASVLTQNNIFPLLSNRINVYLFPSGVRYPPGATFNKALQEELDESEFIVVDMKSNNIVAPTILSYISKNSDFGVYASFDGALILKRNYTQTPMFFDGLSNIYDYNSLVLIDGSVVKDANSTKGYALLHASQNKPSSLFWSGPYVFLPPGEYTATFRLKLDYPSDGALIYLYVSNFQYNVNIDYKGTNSSGYHLSFKLSTSGEAKEFAQRNLYSSDFNESNIYYEFPLNFTVSEFGAYEFRGTTPTNSSDIFLDHIVVTQTKPSENMTTQIVQNFPTS